MELKLKSDLSSTSTMAARSEMGEATAGSVAVGDLSDCGVSDRGLVSDPPRRFVWNWRGDRTITGVE